MEEDENAYFDYLGAREAAIGAAVGYFVTSNVPDKYLHAIIEHTTNEDIRLAARVALYRRQSGSHHQPKGEEMSEEGYNGWKNYPTWCVNLWLSNDERLYNEAMRITRLAIDASHHTTKTSERVMVGDDLEAWVGDLSPDLGASFAADLLGYALDQVDWHEIADAWIEQVGES